MLTLTVLRSSPIPRESDFLSPEKLRGKSLEEIASLPIYEGNRLLTLGKIFRIEGSSQSERLEIRGDTSTLKRVGEKMQRGKITVMEAVGMHLGAEMSGGEIEVHGDASDWAGAEMSGGTIRIRGNAGDRVGGAYPGSQKGMRGGTLLVYGDAGHEIGANMRRGSIAVGGKVGDFAGIAMIAGIAKI